MAGSKYVCPCKHVTEEDIRKAIADGATSFKQVRKATGAGSKCGKCKPAAKKLVKRLLAEQDDARELRRGGVYRHFKGDYYLVEDVARHSETGEVPSIVFRTFVSQGPVPVAGASSVS